MTWQVGLYVAAVLIPLAAFTIELLLIRLLGRFNAVVATGAIGLSFLLSLVGFIAYFSEAEGVFSHHGHASAEVEAEASPVPPTMRANLARQRPNTTARWSGARASTGSHSAERRSRPTANRRARERT